MRKEKETYPKVRAIKPLFWKECRWCGDKFKWELGYEILDYTVVNAHLYYSYCCSKCAEECAKENAEAAIIKLMEDDHKKLMDMMPDISKAPKKIIDTRFDKVNCITCLHFPLLEKSMMNGEMGHAAPRPCCVCYPHDFDVPCDRVKRCKYEENVIDNVHYNV